MNLSFNRVEVYEYPAAGSNNQSPRSVAGNSHPTDYVKKIHGIDFFESERMDKRRSMEQFHKSDLYREWIIWQEKLKHVDEENDYIFFGARRPSIISKLNVDEARKVDEHLHRHHHYWEVDAVTDDERVFGITEPYKLAMERVKLSDDVGKARKADEHLHHNHHNQGDAVSEGERVFSFGVTEPYPKENFVERVKLSDDVDKAREEDEHLHHNHNDHNQGDTVTEDEDIFGVTEPYKLAMERVKLSDERRQRSHEMGKLRGRHRRRGHRRTKSEE